MSTSVQMPVRVKPPPAELGDTISPGCASFETATPLNGARTTVLSRFARSTSIWRSVTRTCSRPASIRATSESTAARAVSRSAAVFRRSAARRCARSSASCASTSRTSLSRTLRRAASACAMASASDARNWASSSRASTCPSLMAMPSSTFTSTTLPVIFEETVARRRAVT